MKPKDLTRKATNNMKNTKSENYGIRTRID